MSASNKKKLRKEQAADVLTAKQTQEKAEAKKLKIYTISFLVAMIVVVCAAAGILGVRAVRNSGIIEKNTIAAHVGDRELNTVELSYYYIDIVNQFYNEWYSYYSDNTDTYLQTMGLNPAKPLDEQVYDEESGQTWSEYFIEEAIKQAASDYAMCDLANAENFALPEEDKATVDSTINMLNTYAAIYGYNNTDQYLRAMYGYGSTLDSYSEYYERTQLANAYYTAYKDTLTYTADDRATYAADKEITFNSYDYDSVYMSYTYFREGGTEDEDGKKTYSAEENEAARKKMKEVAEQLATATSAAELKEKVAEVKLSEGSSMSVTENKNMLYNSISTKLSDWLTDESRQEGDIAAIPNETKTTAEDGTETTEINGYYVVIYHGSTDNTSDMANLGFIFAPYEGGTKDEETEETVYTDAEKAAAKTKVEGFLDSWNSGEKTLESLEELADKLIEDGDASSGGLVEDLHVNSEYHEDIVNWALAAERTEGETSIIEADNGFYLLYYAGKPELNYREYMIESEMRAADYQEWYEGVVDAVETSTADLSKMDLGITLSAG